MTGNELAVRFIEDIQKSISIRNSIRDFDTIVANTGLSNNDDMQEFISASNVSTFDGHLKNVIQIINFREELIKGYESNGKLNVDAILNNLTENEERLKLIIEDKINNDSYRGYPDGQPISKTLIKELNEVHNYAR